MNTSTVTFKPLSEEMRQAQENFKAYEALDESRRDSVRLVMVLCDFARMAYEAAKGWRPEDNSKTPEQAERSRSLEAGEFASQYLAVFKALTERLGGDWNNTVATVGKVSDWLKSKGLNGIPSFITESASTTKVIYKDSRQIHHDMFELMKFAADTRAEMAAQSANQESSRRKAA